VITGKVVDASAIVALLLDETTADEIAATLDGHRLIAPVLLYFEFTHACLKKAKLYPERRQVFFSALDKLDAMGIEIVPVEYREVLSLAERYQLTAYDASYLWLAREQRADLVTLDAKLARTAIAVLGQ
jgi:predicted nucleic acid-binding protein